MTALGDFSSGDVLTAADLNAIGTWTTYTPTVTNWTGTFSFAKYLQVNKLVFVRWRFIANSTSTGAPSFSLPVAGVPSGAVVGADFSSSGFWVSSGGGIAQIWPYMATSTTANWYIIGSGVLSAGEGSGSEIRYIGVYEAA